MSHCNHHSKLANYSYKKISFANKLYRVSWFLVWILLFRPTPRFMHVWRVFLLRIFGANLGRGVHVYPTARVWAPYNLTMGERSCLGDYVDCYSVDKILIGDETTISQYSFLCTASHDYHKKNMPLITSPISIGSQVWITADVFVGPGVILPDGVVITARSSVLKSVPPWTVCSGSPAVAIRSREQF